MDEYVLDPALRHLLKKRAKLGIGDVTAATAQDIDSYNRSEFKQSVFKSLYKPKTKNIISRTFIIPVTDGAVTGYLFEKVKDKAIIAYIIIERFFAPWRAEAAKEQREAEAVQ